MLRSIHSFYRKLFCHFDADKRQTTIEGKTVYRILLIGYSSFLACRCLEDLLLRAANNAGIGLVFVDTPECDLCVVSADELLGHRIGSLCDTLRHIRAPIVAFGLGTEGTVDQFPRSARRGLGRILKK